MCPLADPRVHDYSLPIATMHTTNGHCFTITLCPIVLIVIPFGRKLNGLLKITLDVFYKNLLFLRYFHLKVLNDRHFERNHWIELIFFFRN